VGSTENRPGVTSFILKPEQASEYVESAISRCSDISVVGVAGPGDSLVGDNMFTAFRYIGESHPNLLKCISTNGLLLLERAEELIDIGIDTLTVTVNAVDPFILSDIVPAIHYKGERLVNIEAAFTLLENQLMGIKRMAKAGTTIKINTVLVPGLNDEHIPDIARTVSRLGTNIYNIIPLIPQHLLADREEPTCELLDDVREEAGRYIDVFRHCQHCRADAVGIPGISDFSSELRGFSDGQTATEEVFSHG
jgi:nitrogen fixation protein NifB